MKVEDWCTQKDVSRHAYYYWLRKIRKDACENLTAVREEIKPVPFKKLEVTAPVPNTAAAVIIHLPYAAVYSIIETAKANCLSVYTYLEYLLLYMQDTD